MSDIHQWLKELEQVIHEQEAETRAVRRLRLGFARLDRPVP